jgi:hypothetical protein
MAAPVWAKRARENDITAGIKKKIDLPQIAHLNPRNRVGHLVLGSSIWAGHRVLVEMCIRSDLEERSKYTQSAMLTIRYVNNQIC